MQRSSPSIAPPRMPQQTRSGMLYLQKHKKKVRNRKRMESYIVHTAILVRHENPSLALHYIRRQQLLRCLLEDLLELDGGAVDGEAGHHAAGLLARERNADLLQRRLELEHVHLPVPVSVSLREDLIKERNSKE